MAQVTIYINNELEAKVKEIAKSLDTSISKYISGVLEKNLNDDWNANIKKLAGSWRDFPTAEEIREETAQDIKKETF